MHTCIHAYMHTYILYLVKQVNEEEWRKMLTRPAPTAINYKQFHAKVSKRTKNNNKMHENYANLYKRED